MKTPADTRLADYRLREIQAAKAILEQPKHYPPSQIEWAEKLIERELKNRGVVKP